MSILWKVISVVTLAAVIVLAAFIASGNGRLGTPVMAQGSATGGTATPNGITVTADGKASAQPDVAYVNLGVQTQGATAKEAMDKNTAQMNSLIAKLGELGIDKKDMQTGSLNVYPRTFPPKTPDAQEEITGYWANNSLNVTINDLAKAGDVLDASISAGANSLGGVRFGLKDDSKLREQALQVAVKAARPKADTIATGLSLKVSGITSVVELGGGAQPMPATMALGKGADSSVPVEGGQLTVTVSVQVTFSF